MRAAIGEVRGWGSHPKRQDDFIHCSTYSCCFPLTEPNVGASSIDQQVQSITTPDRCAHAPATVLTGTRGRRRG